MPDWKAYVRERLQLNSQHPQKEEEIIEELAVQLEEIYTDSLREGNSEADAMIAAESHISDWSIFARQLRESRLNRSTPPPAAHEVNTRSGSWLKIFFSQLPASLVFAARALAKSPRLVLTAVFTITLVIGAITAIFSVLNGVILQPLPYPRSEQIVWTWGKFSQGDRAAVSPPDFQDFRAQSKSFEHFAAMHVMHQWVNSSLSLARSNEPVRLNGSQVTAGFFEVFGSQPQLGRTFRQSDEVKGAAPAVVLSNRAWKNYFGSDPHIVGKPVRLNRAVYTVIGVMKAGFQYPLETDAWMPLI